MDRSCGNCAMVLDETERLVKCQPDLLPAVWHEKTAVCRTCEYFKPKHQELHLRMVELQVEYYQGENKTPIAVVAKCVDGGDRRFSVGAGKVGQVRLAGWVKDDQFYTENEVRYRREIWRPRGMAAAAQDRGLPVVVSTKDEIEG